MTSMWRHQAMGGKPQSFPIEFYSVKMNVPSPHSLSRKWCVFRAKMIQKADSLNEAHNVSDRKCQRGQSFHRILERVVVGNQKPGNCLASYVACLAWRPFSFAVPPQRFSSFIFHSYRASYLKVFLWWRTSLTMVSCWHPSDSPQFSIRINGNRVNDANSQILTGVAVFSRPTSQASTDVVTGRVATRYSVDTRSPVTLVSIQLTVSSLPTGSTSTLVSADDVDASAVILARIRIAFVDVWQNAVTIVQSEVSKSTNLFKFDRPIQDLNSLRL